MEVLLKHLKKLYLKTTVVVLFNGVSYAYQGNIFINTV